MAQTKARTSVKDKALYKRLRNLGVSVKESTRVANAGAKTSRRKAGQRVPDELERRGRVLAAAVAYDPRTAIRLVDLAHLAHVLRDRFLIKRRRLAAAQRDKTVGHVRNPRLA